MTKPLLITAKCVVAVVFIFATYRMILHVGTSTNVFKYVAIVAVLIGLLISEIERRNKLKRRYIKM